MKDEANERRTVRPAAPEVVAGLARPITDPVSCATVLRNDQETLG
jgi:hypothetical protein